MRLLAELGCSAALNEELADIVADLRTLGADDADVEANGPKEARLPRSVLVTIGWDQGPMLEVRRELRGSVSRASR